MPQQQIPKQVLDYWEAKGLSRKKMTEFRRRCQTDLLFLCRALGYPDLDDKVHGEVCAFFVQKNPDVPFREFAEADQTSHERLIMVSRGGLKSTIGTVCDTVQYIVCWPDITILLINGKDDLGRQFVKEIREHFERMDDGSPRQVNGESSRFQLAFPEFCTDGVVAKDTYVCPARTAVNIKEPTVKYGGVETDLSGPHYDVVKGDDCVTNENSRNPERLKTIRNQMSMHHKVRQPWGYFDNIGTWYDLSDSNGERVMAEERNKTLFNNRGNLDSRATGTAEVLTHIMIRPCMRRRDGAIPAVDGLLREDEWELWWPQRLTWRYLMGEKSNLDTFATQYMQNPGLGRRVKITRESLVRATKPFTQLPDLSQGHGILVQNWDTAYKAGNWWNNWSVGTTMLILNGKFYVVDIVRGQWNETDLPKMMAQTAYRWRPKRVAIEDANGVRFLAKTAMQEYAALGLKGLWIEFRPVDNAKGSKENNIKPFAKALQEDRVVISNAIPGLDYVYEEFEKFPNGDFDDVVDSVATAVQFFGEIPEALVKMTEEETRQWRLRQSERLQYERIYGTGRFSTSPSGQKVDSADMSSGFPVDPWKDFGV